MQKKDCYLLGRITRTHGLQGNLVLKLDTDQPEFYKKLEGIFIEINGLLVPFFVDKQQYLKSDTKLISFKNSTPQLLEQVVGREVYLPLESLPPLSGKSFYYHEVVGYRLIDTEGRVFGVVQSVNDQTAQHYFLLDLEGKQVIVPIIKDWIKDLNREEKIITMELPEGLLEVFTTVPEKDE